jgi:alcohol dehydrogenase
MKALVYVGSNEVAYREEPDPKPGDGEALVRIEAVGICGSDMHAYHGHDPRRVPPLILGHEAVGQVVGGPAAGKRVVLNPLVTCGVCDACAGGRPNLCAARQLIGMNRPGAFAELVAMPTHNLIEIPQGMAPAHAALTEPCATALHALALAARASHRPLAEGRALVLGGGSVGLLAALLLRSQGARSILLGETNALRRESAAATGAVEVYNPAKDATEAGAFDLVIDAVGGAATRKTALAAVRPGGVVMHIGLMDSAGEADFRKLTLAEITLIGTYTYTPVDLRAALAALHSGVLGTLNWAESRLLAEGARAFDDLDKGRTAAAKVVLLPG